MDEAGDRSLEILNNDYGASIRVHDSNPETKYLPPRHQEVSQALKHAASEKVSQDPSEPREAESLGSNVAELPVLDHGYVRLVTYTPWNAVGLEQAVRNGDLEQAQALLTQHDLSAVNAARASFAKEKDTLGTGDLGLLRFLAEAQPVPHSSPFRHNHVTLEVYAPLFVCRQWWRHAVGAATLEEGTPWSELSRRYVRGGVEFYLPEFWEWRAAAENVKQGSGGLLYHTAGATAVAATNTTRGVLLALVEQYEHLIAQGVAPEQARMILPQNIYTSFRWSPSVQALANFLVQRLDDHAQKEIRDYAQAVQSLTKNVFPHSLRELTK